MTSPFRARSISTKLTWLNLLVTGLALLLACTAFLAYDFFSYRQNLIQNLQTAAQIAGANSITALTFDDPQAAENTLKPLQGSPDVLWAAIVSQDGKVFAEYREPGESAEFVQPTMGASHRSAQWINGSQVLVASRIMFSGKSIGIVYIRAQFSELGPRVRRYGMTAGIIFLLCVLASLLATATFRRLVTRPITALAATARVVSREKDFSVRAEETENQDEIAVLVEAFNEMLQEIQVRDRELADTHATLERRVQERTAELRAANRELEAFSYSVAHDLRGPLEVIGGMGYVLQHSFEEKLGAEGAGMLQTVQRSTKDMANLIDDLLNMARATTVGLERKKVDLSAMARSIAEDLTIAEPQRQVKFTIKEGAIVYADPGLMNVVMSNLIRNAWKYTSHHDQAAIEFSWTQRDGTRVFFVRDDGAGFDQAKAGRLFRPFQRLHATSDFPGTGIGLATVQRILARHGGSIWAEGREEHGATFFFTLA